LTALAIVLCHFYTMSSFWPIYFVNGQFKRKWFKFAHLWPNVCPSIKWSDSICFSLATYNCTQQKNSLESQLIMVELPGQQSYYNYDQLCFLLFFFCHVFFTTWCLHNFIIVFLLYFVYGKLWYKLTVFSLWTYQHRSIYKLKLMCYCRF